MVSKGQLRFSILSQKQAAQCLSYLRVDHLTARMEDYLVEDGRMLPDPHVSNGAPPLAPGPSHTLSGTREKIMCPGPLPQECISSEVALVRGRQRR